MSSAAGAVRVDLNADVGEGFGRWVLGDDEAVLALVGSANVACGFHAGDPVTLRRCCEVAAARGVVVGAQVGYRDLAGFGRRFLDVDPDELTAEVAYQVGALEAVAAYDPSLPLLGLPGWLLLAEAERSGLRTVREAFGDHGYTPEGTLVPRTQPGAVLEDLADSGVTVEAFA